MDLLGEGAPCLDAFVSACFDTLEILNPWGRALQILSQLVNADHIALRISQRDSKGRSLLLAAGAGYISDDNLFSGLADKLPAFLRSDEVITSFLKDAEIISPQIADAGSSSEAITCFCEPLPGVECILAGIRSTERDPFSAQDRRTLKMAARHFGAAVRLRRGLLRGRVVRDLRADALEQMAIAGFLVTANRTTALALNNRARDIVESQDGLTLVNGVLHATDSYDDRKFQAAIRSILTNQDRRPEQQAMSLKRASGLRDLGVLISAQDSPSLITNRVEQVALVYVRDPSTAVGLDVTLLQELFSFTRAEAKVAVCLANGMRMQDMERTLKIKHNTARAHLRSIFSKAEVGRQAELIHLLASSAVPLGGNALARGRR